jgi:glycosyltransferase involved in cell wall biosynthesis
VSSGISATLVIVVAYNEEACIGTVLDEVRRFVPELDILVVNDGSVDRTVAVAREKGVRVLDIPCNLGVGGAVQAGCAYAYENGYEFAVRIDGDGQHPPREIPTLLAVMSEAKTDLVTGSRFLGQHSYTSSPLRRAGINVLCVILSAICRRRVTDPTSGFQVLNRPLLYFFSKHYPADYPEPEALALLRRQGYDFQEVAVEFRGRLAGESSISGWGTMYYIVKVLLALVVDRARPVDPRYARHNVVGKV